MGVEGVRVSRGVICAGQVRERSNGPMNQRKENGETEVHVNSEQKPKPICSLLFSGFRSVTF